MKVDMIQDYVGDEDCFSEGKHYIPDQYFKCLETGAKMIFKFYPGTGWTVAAPKGVSIKTLLRYSRVTGNKIPFPSTPEKYQKQQNEFYEALENLLDIAL